MTICFSCKTAPVAEEYQRCSACEQSHQELCAKLDSKPRVKEKRVREELFPIKEMKNGIQMTTWISREDARNMGIKLQ